MHQIDSESGRRYQKSPILHYLSVSWRDIFSSWLFFSTISRMRNENNLHYWYSLLFSFCFKIIENSVWILDIYIYLSMCVCLYEFLYKVDYLSWLIFLNCTSQLQVIPVICLELFIPISAKSSNFIHIRILFVCYNLSQFFILFIHSNCVATYVTQLIFCHCFDYYLTNWTRMWIFHLYFPLQAECRRDKT